MRLLKIPLVSFLLMLGGQFAIPPVQVYAACCMSCPCKITCICPGVGGCRYFYCPPQHPDNSTILQVQKVSDEEFDIRANYESPSSPDMKVKGIDRLITVASSARCAQNNYVQKFFQSPEATLKYGPDYLNYNAGEGNIIELVARQMP
jgi:hypothetical protein